MIEEPTATLWFAAKELKRENKLSVHVGKNEKTKVIIKITKVNNMSCVTRSTHEEIV